MDGGFPIDRRNVWINKKKVVRLGGYVTMIKNSEYLPHVEDVFTINSNRFNISQNIKKSFDPKRILNPGKMYTGI